MSPLSDSLALINAAFDRTRLLEQIWGDDIPWSAIAEGFIYEGEKVLLANRARGIFKPRQLKRGIVSIKTTEPRQGRITNDYNDTETGGGFYQYSLQSGDPRGGGNKNLWEAYEDQSPFIYFHAVAAGVYKAIWPCFAAAIDPDNRVCQVVAGISKSMGIEQLQPVIYQMPGAPEQAYAIRESRIRLYQATFRENVLQAYGNRCAISRLPVPQLLEAAHITPDSEHDTSTDITNGIAMSRIHHRAYDSNLIGITPDLKVVVSHRLRRVDDGNMLDAIKSHHGRTLKVPKHPDAYPDRNRLQARFEIFRSSDI